MRPSQPRHVYVEQLATMKERELTTLYVNFEHVHDYDQARVGRGCQAGSEGGPAGCMPKCNTRAPATRAPPCSTLRACLLSSLPFEHLTGPLLAGCHLQSLAENIVEACYRLEPFLRAAVRNFVREHLDTYAEKEDGSDKEFWVSFYNLPVRSWARRGRAREGCAAGGGGAGREWECCSLPARRCGKESWEGEL